MNTNDYLDAVAKRHAVGKDPLSDYRVSQLLGVGRQAVSTYRKGHSRFDEEVAVRVAKLLDIDPAQVFIDMALERTKCPEAKRVWQRLAKRLAATTIAVVLAVSLGIPEDSYAASAPPPLHAADAKYILC